MKVYGMGFFRRINQWFSKSQQPSTKSGTTLLSDLIDKARRSQYAERFDAALEFLTEAMEIAKSDHNINSQVDITLSRADILIAKRDYETARFVLNELRDDTETREMRAPLAYSLSSLGVLEQAQGNLTKAQEHFEDARDIAEKINTDGAYGRATAHLAEIYLAQDNASYAVYLLEDAIPKLDRSGDRELLAYFFAQLGLAQIQNGQADKGRISLQRGLELASHIKHQSQLRYINTILGEQALQDGDYRRAQSYFDHAFKLYLPQSRETADYIKLLCKLSKLYLHLGQADKALELADSALPIAEKLAALPLIAMSKAAIASAKYASNDDNSISFLKEASTAYEPVAIDAFAIEVLRNLARAQISAGEIESGIESFQDAINKAENLPFELGQVHSDLASYHADNRNLREALNEWQVALQHFTQANQTDYVARVICDIASMYEQLGDGRMAQREYGKALEMLSQIENSRTRGIILANVASAYSEYGDVDSAQDFFKEAIEIAQRNMNHHAESLRRGNYGRLLALTNQPKQALTQIMQAQKLSDKLGLELQSAIMLGNLALAYSAMNDYTSATERYNSALSLLNTLDANKWVAVTRANLADMQLSQNNFEDSSANYEIAYSLAKDLALVDVLIQTLMGQTQVALESNNLNLAQEKINEADPIARRLGYRRLNARYLQVKSHLYAKQGQTDDASTTWEDAQKIRKIMGMPPIIPEWL